MARDIHQSKEGYPELESISREFGLLCLRIHSRGTAFVAAADTIRRNMKIS
jgi:hypothetical protein